MEKFEKETAIEFDVFVEEKKLLCALENGAKDFMQNLEIFVSWDSVLRQGGKGYLQIIVPVGQTQAALKLLPSSCKSLPLLICERKTRVFVPKDRKDNTWEEVLKVLKGFMGEFDTPEVGGPPHCSASKYPYPYIILGVHPKDVDVYSWDKIPEAIRAIKVVVMVEPTSGPIFYTTLRSGDAASPAGACTLGHILQTKSSVYAITSLHGNSSVDTVVYSNGGVIGRIWAEQYNDKSDFSFIRLSTEFEKPEVTPCNSKDLDPNAPVQAMVDGKSVNLNIVMRSNGKCGRSLYTDHITCVADKRTDIRPGHSGAAIIQNGRLFGLIRGGRDHYVIVTPIENLKDPEVLRPVDEEMKKRDSKTPVPPAVPPPPASPLPSVSSSATLTPEQKSPDTTEIAMEFSGMSL